MSFALFSSRKLRIELIFFIIYFYLFRILTDLEYNLWEKHHLGIAYKDIEYSLAFGTSSMIGFIFFYRGLYYCLNKNRLMWLFIFIPVFLVSYHFYEKGIYYLYAHLSFFSEELRRSSLKYFKSESLGYGLIYTFREFLAIGSLAYFVYSSDQKEELRVLKEEKLLSELTYLKAQLQPHFFFNTLNNIYALALRKSADTAPLVARLSEMMRYILYESNQDYVLLQHEISFIQNYVDVERIRYRSEIKIDLDVQGIRQHDKIAPLLLLPFIENAFKHGIAEETTQGFVSIVICKTEKELLMEIKNSISSARLPGGIGLQNVQKRLNLLYPGRFTLQAQQDGKIYQLNLSLMQYD